MKLVEDAYEAREVCKRKGFKSLPASQLKGKFMGKRKMPKAGFYVRPPTIGIDINGKPWRSGGSICYTTGVRGGGGHKYIRFDLSDNRFVPNDVSKWATLLWSCVPGKKDLPNLLYTRTMQKAVDIYNSGMTLRYLDYGKYQLEKLGSNPDPIKIAGTN